MQVNNELTENDFVSVLECPWCMSVNKTFSYKSLYDSKVFYCDDCGLLYSDKILNENGFKKYWTKYSSSIHTADYEKTKKRSKMYEIEYNFIHVFLKKGRVLDVGCGEGEFLDLFKKDGFITEGIEYGEEAAKLASQKHKLYYGKLPEINLEVKYDLIIFRCSIQYLLNPKKYFSKAISLLNDGGLIFITSSPNADSICCKLFKDKFTLPVTPMDYFMFSEKILDGFFLSKNMHKIVSKHFYEETPYYSEDDFDKIKNVIRGDGKDIKSPAWFDNMISVVYMKIN